MAELTGEELYNILNPYDPSACANPARWDQTDEDYQAHLNRAAQAVSQKVREETIEECARIADRYAQDVFGLTEACAAADNIADEIRSLKGKANDTN